MRLLFGAVMLVLGCATNPPPEQDASTDVVRATIAPGEALDLTQQTLFYDRTFVAPRPQVWNALLTAEQDVAMGIETADSAGGTVVFYIQTATPRIAGRHASAWLDCGRGPGGSPRINTYHLTLRLSVVVESTPENQTRARTAVVAYARDRSVIGDRLPCTSTGQLEKRALAILAARLAP